MNHFFLQYLVLRFTSCKVLLELENVLKNNNLMNVPENVGRCYRVLY
jgi:hypothetical protein